MPRYKYRLPLYKKGKSQDNSYGVSYQPTPANTAQGNPSSPLQSSISASPIVPPYHNIIPADTMEIRQEIYNSKGYREVDKNKYGHTGIHFFGGYEDWENNPQLRTYSNRMSIWKQMGNSDVSIKQSLNILSEPIKSKTAQIVPFDDSKESILQKEFIEDQILKQSNISTRLSYLDHIIEACQHFQYGFFPFEIIWEDKDWITRNGKVIRKRKVIKELAARLPISIRNWWVEHGNLMGIIQLIPMGDLREGVINEPHIPFEKMIVYVNEKFGNNYEGVSILRPVWKHWKMKEALYKIEMMGLQKNAFGIPVLYIASPTAQKVESAEQSLRALQLHEEAGLVLQKEKEELSFFNAGIDSVSIQRGIQHHDQKILQNVFAGFMLLGQENRGGGRSLGGSLIEFFMMSLQSKSKYMDEVLNMQLIPKMIDANYLNIKGYPRISSYCGRVQDQKQMAEIIKMMVDATILDPTDISLKKFTQTIFGFPTIEEVVKKSGITEIPKNNEKSGSLLEQAVRTRLPIKNSENFDKYRERWNKEANNIIEKQVVELSNSVVKLINEGMMPNINFFDITHQEEIENLLNEYNDVYSLYFNDRMENCELVMIMGRYTTEIKAKILDGIVEVARERKTLA